MARITIITHVHNPGKYIYPCVDSVLNQTFRDFKYVIVDNASSDGTKEVLEAYAEKDDRICLCRNEDNSASTIPSLETYVDTEYFMILDHDDYLEPDALELLYEMAEKYDMDMVFGRCEMVDAEGNHLENAGIEQTMEHMEGEYLIRYFPALYWQLRTVWGKLIRKDLITHIDKETYHQNRPSCYGGDTVIILGMAFSAKRMGTVGKVLHHYRILDKSQSRVYNRKRFLSDWTLLDMGMRLLTKANGLTQGNEHFLYRVYCSAIVDTLRMAMRSNATPKEKCEVVREIITKEQTILMCQNLFPQENDYEMFVKQFGGAILELYVACKVGEEATNLALDWLKLLFTKELCREKELEVLLEKNQKAALFLCVGQKKQAYENMDVEQSLEGWPELYLTLALSEEKNVKQMAQILFKAGKKDETVYEKADKAIHILAEQNMFFCNIAKDVIKEIPEVVVAVCAEEYVDAANICLELLEQEKWQKSGGLLEITISLAALLEEAELFVMLKKCECEFLLQEGNLERARIALQELEEMCPEDEEVELLKQQITL